MFHANAGHEKHIITNMKVIESRLQLIMGALAAYLSNKEMERNVWDDICTLEKDIQSCAKEAYEYQNNTFHSQPELILKCGIINAKFCIIYIMK